MQDIVKKRAATLLEGIGQSSRREGRSIASLGAQPEHLETRLTLVLTRLSLALLHLGR